MFNIQKPIRTEQDELKGSQSFAELWTYQKPILEVLSQKLPDPTFKPAIELQLEANAICEMYFGIDLRNLLVTVVNGLLRLPSDVNLHNFNAADSFFGAYNITDRIIYYAEAKELHIDLIPKKLTQGVLLIQLKDQYPGITYYYNEAKKGGTIQL